MGELASRFTVADYLVGRVARFTDVAGAGQSHRAQDTGARVVDVCQWHHAALHAALRVMVEHV